NNCIKLIVVVGPAVEPQVTRRPPRFRHSRDPLKPSPPTCSNTTSTPLFCRELAGHSLKALYFVVDDVIRAECFGFLSLGVVSDGRDNGAAESLGHLDGD